MDEPGVSAFQAEDEIAAVGAAIGASFGGAIGVSASSGPGVALMSESLGLAAMTELPLVVVDLQRAGPSTGMPTKTEQSDLNLALYGRHGDAPLPVLAARSAADCFDAAVEAVRIAVRSMTPVILLADGYVANAAEPWRLPDARAFDPADFAPRRVPDAADFDASRRDPETLARWWPMPGTPGLEHRIGGLEKDAATGAVSYDPANHQRMTEIRVGKTRALRASIPDAAPEVGGHRGSLAVLGWGSTYGPIRIAALRARAAGRDVAHIHLRHLSPLPANLEALLSGYDRVLLPELNMGQLASVLRTEVARPVTSLTKVTGQPFLVGEITEAIREALDG